MPFLFPLVGLIAGIIIGSLFKLPIWGFIPISAACFIYLRLLKKSVKPSLSIRLNRLHKIWVLLLFCGIGMFDIGFQKPMEFQSGELKRYVKAIGEIKESKSYASGDQFIVDV